MMEDTSPYTRFKKESPACILGSGEKLLRPCLHSFPFFNLLAFSMVTPTTSPPW